jgi:hypothetical protein
MLNLDHGSERSLSLLHDAATQTHVDPVILEAKWIILDVMEEMLRFKNKRKPRSKHSVTVIRLVRCILDRHEVLFHAMIVRLGNLDSTRGYSTFAAVCDQVFKGGTVSWGRIIVLYAFAVHLCKRLLEQSPESSDYVSKSPQKETSSLDKMMLKNGLCLSLKDIVEYMGTYVAEKVAPWLKQNGGWKSIESAFPPDDELDRIVWKRLLITAIGLGIATAAICVSR